MIKTLQLQGKTLRKMWSVLKLKAHPMSVGPSLFCLQSNGSLHNEWESEEKKPAAAAALCKLVVVVVVVPRLVNRLHSTHACLSTHGVGGGAIKIQLMSVA